MCVLWLCFGVHRLFSYPTCKKVDIGQSKMANFSPLITKNASPDAPNVEGCPKSPSSLDLGHVSTFGLVSLVEALQMGEKCAILYLSRVAH